MAMFRINDRPVHFFVIEDNMYIVDSFVSIIRQEGGVLLGSAVNLMDALEQINRLGNEIDIITLDINLGKNTSLPVLGLIKSQFPHVQVIVISGLSTESNVKESYLLGTSFFLAKPCSFESFVKTVLAAISSIHAGIVQKEPERIKIAIYELNGQISSYISKMNIRELFQCVFQSDSPYEFKKRLQEAPELVDILIIEYDSHDETSAIEELFLYASSQPTINQVLLAPNNDQYFRQSPVLADFNELVRMTSQDLFSSDLISHVFAYTKNQSRLNPT